MQNNNSTSNKWFSRLILIGLVIIAGGLTLITLKVQQNHRAKIQNTTVSKVETQIKIDKSEEKHLNSTQKDLSSYQRPKTNIISADAQATSHHEYDVKTKSDTLDSLGIKSITDFNKIPKKGIVLLFIYKPNVKSSKDYTKVINTWVSASNKLNNYPVVIFNTDKAKLTNQQFFDFWLSHSGSKGADLPQYRDVYMLAMKNNKVYDYISKTDTNKQSFNQNNLTQIVKALQQAK